MKKKIFHQGELDLSGFKIPCYVLEDGTRIISGRGMQDALKMVDPEMKETAGTRLKRHLGQKSLKPFIFRDKSPDHFTPIVAYLGGKKIHGYEATVLVDICDAFLEARKTIKLSPRQKTIADQCEMLVISFAKVGLIALIDEATGYQKQKDEYQKLVSLYIDERMRKWVKTFKDDYYEQLYKLLDWDWDAFKAGKKNHPQYIGKLTNELVYYKLPAGILEELDRLNPKNLKGNRKHKQHQFLSESVGYRHLIEHLAQITIIAKLYYRGEYKKAKVHIDTLLPDQRKGSQQTLDLPMSISEVASGASTETPSDFNKALKKGLAYNPNE